MENKKGGAVMKVLLILLIAGALFGVKYFIDSSYVKADIGKINKLTNALSFYYGQYSAIPGTNKGNSTMTVKQMYSDLIDAKLVNADDFTLNSVKINLSFHGCQKVTGANGKNFWKLVPLSTSSSICLVRDINKITDYGSKVSDTGETPVNIAFMNNYLICMLETSIDGRNLNDGNGMLVQDGIHNASIESVTDFDCTKYVRNKKVNKDTTSSSYAFKIY